MTRRLQRALALVAALALEAVAGLAVGALYALLVVLALWAVAMAFL